MTNMDCTNKNCELHQGIQSIQQIIKNFQDSTTNAIANSQHEISTSIKDLDTCHTEARQHIETELRGELQRNIVVINTKIDNSINTTNNHLIAINADLGEIKGALGLKTDKDETGKLRISVAEKLEFLRQEGKQEAQKELDKFRSQQYRFSHKILFMVITLLASGLCLALGKLI
jgi:SMC interacting uncharacterized protein involved in chromosome segregation